MLRVTGFGQDGPYAERRAFGTLMEAMSGFAHQTGQEDGPPTLPPFGLADGVAGIAGAYAVLTALYHRDARRRAGPGDRPGAAGAAAGHPRARARPSTTSSASSPARHGNRSPNNAPRNAYVTRDGALGGDLGQRDVDRRAGDAPGRAARPGRRAVVLLRRGAQPRAPRCSTARCRSGSPRATSTTCSRRSRTPGAAIAPIYDVEQLVERPARGGPGHDHHRRRRGPRAAADAEPDLPALGDTPGGIRWAGRRLGQDNEAVLRERSGSTPSRWRRCGRKGWCDVSDRGSTAATCSPPATTPSCSTGCSPRAPTR